MRIHSPAKMYTNKNRFCGGGARTLGSQGGGRREVVLGAAGEPQLPPGQPFTQVKCGKLDLGKMRQ